MGHPPLFGRPAPTPADTPSDGPRHPPPGPGGRIGAMSDQHDPAPYDALLLLSFGGPEGPDDVVPFL
ncbi:hypothetical protein, partial [Streptomyces cinereoruber]|uniref:hypothetical protein n=1 Tax=Streptomyces cinereoruber TaxID=67260 RepID=UPI003EC13DD1